jgi:hypothetical protein
MILPSAGRVTLTGVVERCDVPFRDQHEMHGRLRIDIVEGEDIGVLVQLAALNFAANDLAENAVRVGIHESKRAFAVGHLAPRAAFSA